MSTQTAGQKFTNELRRMFHIGPRTRWYRKGGNAGQLTRGDMLEQIELGVQMPGYFSERRTELFSPAYWAVMSWNKHIEDGRADAVLCWRLKDMTPWQFTTYLGRMVDTGLTNAGQFEVWFHNERTAVQAAA